MGSSEEDMAQGDALMIWNWIQERRLFFAGTRDAGWGVFPLLASERDSAIVAAFPMSAHVPTAAEIRATFLDFFKSKQHTIVPSDNVGYTSRDGARIFTNAGMNQFVPIFLGERSADVDTWPGVLHKGLPTRAADTQKCIRAGGKHNDLEDVGLDTYHHTFFEMLGNWSFGDYFKKEAISWSWELIVERFKFPASRVFATIYQPDKSKGDPAERDEESWELWAEKFRSMGLDPAIHIVNGNKKDNFWMMADTGPCGPCTEIHIDLTPGPIELSEERQREGAKLVNGSDASCIEIWNNVFIQYKRESGWQLCAVAGAACGHWDGV